MRDAENKLFRMTGLWWMVLFVVSMAGMLYVAEHKTLAAAQESAAVTDRDVSSPDAGRVYRMCVVIDPMQPEANEASNGVVGESETETGEDIALAVAEEISALLADTDIRIVVTRTDVSELTAAERAALADEYAADYYISLGLSTSDDPEVYGLSGYYNAEYFIPEYGNAEFADALLRSVTLAVSDRAVGLYAAGEASVLAELSIPAAQINLGYVTNGTEYGLLQQEVYRTKLAQGIADILLELLEQKETEATP